MGVVLWLYAAVFADALRTDGLRYLALLGLVGLGIVTYFGSAQLLGGFRLSELRGAMRRKRG